MQINSKGTLALIKFKNSPYNENNKAILFRIEEEEFKYLIEFSLSEGLWNNFYFCETEDKLMKVGRDSDNSIINIIDDNGNILLDTSFQQPFMDGYWLFVSSDYMYYCSKTKMSIYDNRLNQIDIKSMRVPNKDYRTVGDGFIYLDDLGYIIQVFSKKWSESRNILLNVYDIKGNYLRSATYDTELSFYAPSIIFIYDPLIQSYKLILSETSEK